MIDVLEFLLSPIGVMILIVGGAIWITMAEQDRLRKKSAQDRVRWLARDEDTRSKPD